MVLEQQESVKVERPKVLSPEYVAVAPSHEPVPRRSLDIELFAWGVHNPSHMEWTPDGRLLLSDVTAGRVFDITDGGDLSEKAPVAEGLAGPTALVPVDDMVLVVESIAGRISNIANGRRETFASGINFPYSAALYEKDGRRQILASEVVSEFRAQYLDITSGGERASFDVFISDIPRRRVQLFAGKHPTGHVDGNGQALPGNSNPGVLMNGCNTWLTRLVFGDGSVHLGMKVGALGAFMRIPDAGGSAFDLLEDRANVLASGLDPVGSGCIQHPTSRRVYVTQPLTGEIRAFDLDAPGYLGFEPPVVSGINQPTCVRFSPDGRFMYACGQGDGVVWRIANFA